MNKLVPEACEDCSKSAREKGMRTECEKCGKPELTTRNEIVLWFIRQIGGALSDGWGNPNIPGISEAMKVYGVKKQDRPWLLKQITLYMDKRRGERSKTGDTRRR